MASRVEILERALRWYADPKNWKEDDWGCLAVIDHPDYGDAGKKARNALARAARVTETPTEEEEPVGAVTDFGVISAVWKLHDRNRVDWPTAAAIAEYLETTVDVVRPILRSLKESRIFRDRRRRGETVWGPWDGAEFERR